MRDSELQYEIVTDEQKLLALKGEWDDLLKRANGFHYQSFDFCWIAWQQVARPKGRSLRCIVLRDKGKLVLVWPLVAHKRFLWTCLCPLCPEAADYSDLLVDPWARSAECVESAWRVAMRECGADFLHLPFLHERTHLYRIASKAGPLVIQRRSDSYVAKLSEECAGRDWASFSDSLGPPHGRKPGSIARRLSKKGHLEWKFIDPCDKSAVAYAVDLMFEWKRHWSDRVGKRGPWLDSVHYRNFLVEWISSQSPSSRAHLLMIALDSVPIVSLVFCVSNNRVSTVIGSFNEAYAKSSPGLLAFEYVVKWAFDRQYDVDFGSGAERYKQFWARGNVTNVWTLRTVASWWGRIGMIVQRLPFEVKHTTREGTFAAPSSTASARYASTGNSHEI
ncbi:GNAT family N-acetyltransferase [Paraburkholderia hospita]|uniref:GNAT family N-acetyltransferase n=1 Tax=Paraburkholderia hospita TaxID=169430 RepID=A0AAN1J8X0_9BURK|nr:GNAT family N-acetyltransferase [Paraburkholderia hospita]AUT69406.1 GNAT family N-acetyltransferase [Paraburkholderia hospita]SEI22296.1 Acetyltransferase involved in cellulose biosynthesis, CelD/BcsL family [Paraburkholderia hospita]